MNSNVKHQMENLSKYILIIGGGVIRIEWASMLTDLGVEVTVIEYSSQILPTEDDAVAKEVEKLLKKRGIKFVKGAKTLAETLTKDDGVAVDAEVNGKTESFHAEKLLVSVGREGNTTNIGLENTDVAVENGVIQTNEFYQTKESHIYAIGDVIGGMQLAHVASHEGIAAVEHMADQNPHPLNYNNF